jgi:hypothetical protein
MSEEVSMKSKQPRAVGLNDLGQLTLRANVAFAVRCAQRIRPCFELPVDAPRRREQLAAVDGAIRVAAAFCQGLPVEDGRAAEAARRAAVVADETCESTNFAGFAAVRAAEAAAYAEEAGRNPSESSIIQVVAAAFGAGRVVAANSDAFTLDLVAAALYADVEKLRGMMGHAVGGDMGPAVDPSESGPLGSLWPEGTPAWCAR